MVCLPKSIPSDYPRGRVVVLIVIFLLCLVVLCDTLACFLSRCSIYPGVMTTDSDGGNKLLLSACLCSYAIFLPQYLLPVVDRHCVCMWLLLC